MIHHPAEDDLLVVFGDNAKTKENKASLKALLVEKLKHFQMKESYYFFIVTYNIIQIQVDSFIFFDL